MKTLIVIALYALLSWPAGVVAYWYMKWKKKTGVAVVVACSILYGGPPAALGIFLLKEKLHSVSYQNDSAYVDELCAKYGGDKVYRTVENVEGVLQMQPMRPSDSLRGDQYGLTQPWAVIYGDGPESAVKLRTKGGSYWFVEQQPSYEQPKGPPYRRTVLLDSGLKVRDKLPYAGNLDDIWWLESKVTAMDLRSRYGYLVEDIGTKELRRRWIAAGRVTIVDLQTNEVIAERVGYVRGTGPQVLLSWSLGHGCIYPTDAKSGPGIDGFVRSVLHPPAQWPDSTQLKLIRGD